MKKLTKIITDRPNKYMLEYGKSLDEIRKIFGVSKATIINWQKKDEKREWMKKRLEEHKNKNPYLKSDGGIDLIDRFPSYERKGKERQNEFS